MADESGLADLKKRLASLAPAARAAVSAPMQKAAEELVGLMKEAAPSVTGKLRDSITATAPGDMTPEFALGVRRTAGPDQVIVTAGNREAFYAHFVEFGTHKMHAEPFFYPSYNLVKKRIRSTINRALNKAIKTNWGA